MSKVELTQEQIDFKLDPLTLNNQFIYWLTKANCMWNLKETNKKYNEMRKDFDHTVSMENLKKQMFLNGIK